METSKEEEVGRLVEVVPLTLGAGELEASVTNEKRLRLLVKVMKYR